MGRAVLWCGVACLGSLGLSFFIGMVLVVTGLQNRLAVEDRPVLYIVLGIVGAAGVLLWVARHHAAAEYDDWRTGIGDGPIERPWAVVLIALVVSAYAALITVGVISATPQALRQILGVNRILIGSGLLLAVIAAPLAEELFFRGWLWTGLRARWGAVATGTVTSLMWLALHLPDGVGRVTLLVPAAIALPLARHCGRSVRASLVVHACNNAAVGVAPAIGLWLGWLAGP